MKRSFLTRAFVLLTCLLASPAGAEEEILVAGKSIPVRLRGIPQAAQEELKRLIQEQLVFSPDAVPTAPLADDLAYFTRLQLTNQGWKSADVQWEIKQGEIHLNCTAGEVLKLGKITWTGDASPVSSEDLEGLLLRALHEAHGKKELPWVADTVEGGVSLVERRLQAEGHLAAEADLTSAERGAEVDVSVKLTVGPRTTFGKIHLLGADDCQAKEMAPQIAALEGAACNQARLDDLGRKLASQLQKLGWLAAKVESSVALGKAPATKDGAVEATLLVIPGPQTTVQEIQASDTLSAGAQRVLKALFSPMQGHVWQARELELHFRRALDSGLFAKLDYTAEPLPNAAPLADGTLPAILKLTGEESRPYQLGLSGGFDTFLGPFVGAELSGVNLWDQGVRWRIAGEFGGFGPAATVSLTEPSLFGTGFTGTAEAAIQHMLRYDYVSTTGGAKLVLGRRVSLPFSYTAYSTVLLGMAEGPEMSALELGPDSYAAITLGGSFQLDYRDSPVLPTKGLIVEGRLEGTDLVSDVSAPSYLKADVRISWFHPLGDTWKFGTGLNCTGIAGPEFDELPIDLRVFNGGGQSVRSFGERELGLISATGRTPLGGTMALTLSAEISREIAPNLDLAFFADAGGLTLDGTWGLPEDFRYAVGLGLRYKLPFGPLRLDYGWNPDKREGEPFGTFHVALGFPF